MAVIKGTGAEWSDDFGMWVLRFDASDPPIEALAELLVIAREYNTDIVLKRLKPVD